MRRQPTGLNVIAVRINRRQAVLLDEIDDQLAVSVKVPFPADQHCVRPLLLHRSEDPLNLRGSPLLREHKNQRNSQSAAGVPQDLPRRTFTLRAYPEMRPWLS